MKKSVTSILLLICLSVSAAEKDEFLAAWEHVQSNSPQVEKFEKKAAGNYHIKFSNLPYDGDMNIIAYDTEPLNDEPGYLSPFVKRGYVEIDLTDADENLAIKFPRTYQKWASTNMLFLDGESNKWVTHEEMQRHLRQQNDKPADQTPRRSIEPEFSFSWETQLLTWFFVLIMLFFLFSAYAEYRVLRKLAESQKQASRELDRNMKQIEESLKLHARTNQLLEELLRELRQQKQQQ